MTERITIGRILGAHGIKGELRLLPLTDFPERFREMKAFSLHRPDGTFLREAQVEALRFHTSKGLYLVTLEGVADRDRAEALKGTLVQIDAEERVPLPEGSYWIDDMMGLEVFDDESGESLGVVVEIFPTGSNDIYLVEKEGIKRPLPAMADVILSIDMENRKMTVRIPEGLWD